MSDIKRYAVARMDLIDDADPYSCEVVVVVLAEDYDRLRGRAATWLEHARYHHKSYRQHALLALDWMEECNRERELRLQAERELASLRKQADALSKALEEAKTGHAYCEDTWYSCPQHPEGCANESWGDECNCGASDHNAVIDDALAAYRGGPIVTKEEA